MPEGLQGFCGDGIGVAGLQAGRSGIIPPCCPPGGGPPCCPPGGGPPCCPPGGVPPCCPLGIHGSAWVGCWFGAQAGRVGGFCCADDDDTPIPVAINAVQPTVAKKTW